MFKALMRRARLIVALTVAGVALAGLAAIAVAGPKDDLKAAKAATARYHSLTQAKKDGYVRASPCVSSPAGAMGIHYANSRLERDPALDPERPEQLLYLPDEDGKLKLVAVEYWVAAADQEPPISDSDRPSLFGRPLDGPMPGHGPGMPYHYDLHVWLWEDNPAGKFAAFNPDLSCEG